MLLLGDTHVSGDLCDQVVPVLSRAPQAVESFFRDPEVVGAGVGIAEE